MKKIILLLSFITVSCLLQAQAIRITVNEQTKNGIKPLADTKFEVTLNDTIKTELTSGSDGMLGKVVIEPGTYKVVLSNSAFAPAETKNVVVTDRKLTSITVTCVPASATKNREKKENRK